MCVGKQDGRPEQRRGAALVEGFLGPTDAGEGGFAQRAAFWGFEGFFRLPQRALITARSRS